MEPAKSKGNTLNVEARGDQEIVVTRDFNAPRELVFRAHSEPELVKRWLLGPDGWTMPVCDIDFRVGGKYRYVWHKEKTGENMGMGGEYRTIERPEKIACTEKFDDPWYPGEGFSTMTLDEDDGKTKFQIVIRYESKEARDMVLASPMESGMAAGYDRLEEVLASIE